MDDEKLCLISIVVVVVMVIVLAGWTYVDEEGWPWEDDTVDKEVLLVQEGDEVSIDYTGYFLGSDDNLGPVFDTSLTEVAENDSIPKSQSFQVRPSYDDLSFTVGAGEMIEGFDNSVRGKKEGDSYSVAIPPELAYGAAYPERILTIDSVEVIPLRETITVDTFETRFPSIPLEATASFTHPFWAWNVEILDLDIEEVTILNQPVFGNEYIAFPWNSTVIDISNERNSITLQHSTSEIDRSLPIPFNLLRNYDPEWGNNALEVNSEDPPMDGFVTEVGGQITIDFNREVQGKTLFFQITINSIKRS